jgi:glycosyltransferase involved in cell wall biosynthesis
MNYPPRIFLVDLWWRSLAIGLFWSMQVAPALRSALRDRTGLMEAYLKWLWRRQGIEAVRELTGPVVRSLPPEARLRAVYANLLLRQARLEARYWSDAKEPPLLGEALRVGVGHPELQIQCALLAIQLGREAWMREQFASVPAPPVHSIAASVRDHTMRLLAMLERGDPAAAAELLRQLPDALRSQELSVLELELLYKADRPDAALAGLRVLLAQAGAGSDTRRLVKAVMPVSGRLRRAGLGRAAYALSSVLIEVYAGISEWKSHAAACRAAGEMEMAVAALHSALALRPGDPALADALASQLFAMAADCRVRGDSIGAERALTEARQIRSKTRGARSWIAKRLRATAKWLEARNRPEAARAIQTVARYTGIQLNPEKRRAPELRYEREAANLLALTETVRTMAAEQSVEPVLRMLRDRLHAMSDRMKVKARLGKLLLAQGKEHACDKRWGDAEYALRLVVGLLPKHEVAMKRLSRVLRQRLREASREKDYLTVQTLASDLLGLMPGDYEVLRRRCDALIGLGAYDLANRAARDMIEADPGAIAGWERLVGAQRMVGANDAVIDTVAEMLRQCPGNDLAAARVAWAAQRPEIADQHMARAIEAAADDPDRLRDIAAVSRERGELGRALSCYERIRAFRGALTDDDAQGESELRRSLQPFASAMPSRDLGELRLPDHAFDLLLSRRVATYVPPDPNYIILLCPSLGPGGVQRQVVSLLETFEQDPRHRFAVAVIAEEQEEHRLHLSRVEALGARVFSCSDPGRAGKVFDDALEAELVLLPRRIGRAVRALLALLETERPAILHAWSDGPNIVGGVAGALTGVPQVLLGARSEAPNTGGRVLARWYRSAYRALLERDNQHLIANSRAGARSYETWLKLPADSVRTVYNAIDVGGVGAQQDSAKATAWKHAHGIPPDCRIVGSLFRPSHEKRPLLWIDTAEALVRRQPDLFFVVLGHGPLAGAMQRRIADCGLDSRFRLLPATDDVVPWLGMMDVVLLTSMFEGTPNVAIEAQALGIPVVAPAVGGIPETFLDGETGVLVGANPDPGELADAVIAVLDDDVLRARTRDRGPALMERRFAPDALHDAMSDVYASLAAANLGIVRSPRDRHGLAG